MFLMCVHETSFYSTCFHVWNRVDLWTVLLFKACSHTTDMLAVRLKLFEQDSWIRFLYLLYLGRRTLRKSFKWVSLGFSVVLLPILCFCYGDIWALTTAGSIRARHVVLAWKQHHKLRLTLHSYSSLWNKLIAKTLCCWKIENYEVSLKAQIKKGKLHNSSIFFARNVYSFASEFSVCVLV